MLIRKILNNNVLLVEKGRKDQIILGPGIGVKYRVGQNYQLNEATDTVFVQIPDDADWLEKFKKLTQTIPQNFFELSEEVIKIASREIGYSFDDHLLIPLTDHIHFAIERQKMGLQLTNPMLFDIKLYFPKEFNVGKIAVDLIKEKLGVSFSEDEAGFIAIHFIEYELDKQKNFSSSYEDLFEICRTVRSIIEASFRTHFDDDDIAVSRLIYHLKVLIMNKRMQRTSTKADKDLFVSLTNTYTRQAVCLNQIINYLEVKLEKKITTSEQLFLLIHLVHITE